MNVNLQRGTLYLESIHSISKKSFYKLIACYWYYVGEAPKRSEHLICRNARHEPLEHTYAPPPPPTPYCFLDVPVFPVFAHTHSKSYTNPKQEVLYTKYWYRFFSSTPHEQQKNSQVHERTASYTKERTVVLGNTYIMPNYKDHMELPWRKVSPPFESKELSGTSEDVPPHKSFPLPPQGKKQNKNKRLLLQWPQTENLPPTPKMAEVVSQGHEHAVVFSVLRCQISHIRRDFERHTLQSAHICIYVFSTVLPSPPPPPPAKYSGNPTKKRSLLLYP